MLLEICGKTGNLGREMGNDCNSSPCWTYSSQGWCGSWSAPSTPGHCDFFFEFYHHRWNWTQLDVWCWLFFRPVIIWEKKDLWLLLEKKAVILPRFQLDLSTLPDKVRPSKKHHCSEPLLKVEKFFLTDSLSYSFLQKPVHMNLDPVSIFWSHSSLLK